MAVSSDGSESYEFGEFRIDVGRRLLPKRNERLNLTPKAFDTLVCLVANAGEVVEKDELMERVWPETVVEENNLNQNISSLRRVLARSAAIIVTLRRSPAEDTSLLPTYGPLLSPQTMHLRPSPNPPSSSVTSDLTVSG